MEVTQTIPTSVITTEQSSMSTNLPVETAVEQTPSPSTLITLPSTYRFTDGKYLDERGSAYQFLLSYFNAIRQHLLPMAYYFWNDDFAFAGPYEAFNRTHSLILPEELSVIKAGEDRAMGSTYTTFGIILQGTQNGLAARWSGCYVIRTPDPALFDSKEYHGRHLIRGKLTQISADVSAKAAIDAACTGTEFGILEVSISNSDDISLVGEKYYIDSRSDPVALISSFWNALNRQEYARAYSYFEAPAIFPGPYITFKNGYLDTRNVLGAITAPEKLAATGNWYWKVPVMMKSETKAGLQQAYIGCYIVHQADPALYVSPPFNPMGIQKARFDTLDPNVEPAIIQAKLAAACEDLP